MDSQQGGCAMRFFVDIKNTLGPMNHIWLEILVCFTSTSGSRMLSIYLNTWRWNKNKQEGPRSFLLHRQCNRMDSQQGGCAMRFFVDIKNTLGPMNHIWLEILVCFTSTSGSRMLSIYLNTWRWNKNKQEGPICLYHRKFWDKNKNISLPCYKMWHLIRHFVTSLFILSVWAVIILSCGRDQLLI